MQYPHNRNCESYQPKVLQDILNLWRPIRYTKQHNCKKRFPIHIQQVADYELEPVPVFMILLGDRPINNEDCRED